MLEDRQSEEEVRSRSSHVRLGPLEPCEHLEYPVSTYGWYPVSIPS